MKNRIAVLITLCFVTLLFLNACSKKHEEELVLFYGNCQVNVNVTPKDAHILIDEIEAGSGHVSVNTPCGQKKIVVEKDGYVVHESFPTVKKGVTLDLDIKLEKMGVIKNWAMSDALVKQIEKGLGPIDVKNPKAEEIAMLNKKEREEDGYQVIIPAPSEAKDDSEVGEQNFDGINFDDPATWQ